MWEIIYIISYEAALIAITITQLYKFEAKSRQLSRFDYLNGIKNILYQPGNITRGSFH